MPSIQELQDKAVRLMAAGGEPYLTLTVVLQLVAALVEQGNCNESGIQRLTDRVTVSIAELGVDLESRLEILESRLENVTRQHERANAEAERAVLDLERRVGNAEDDVKRGRRSWW
jgi:polyhydroxyalkanoate synthesis regulator phasin